MEGVREGRVEGGRQRDGKRMRGNGCWTHASFLLPTEPYLRITPAQRHVCETGTEKKTGTGTGTGTETETEAETGTETGTGSGTEAEAEAEAETKTEAEAEAETTPTHTPRA